MIWTFPNFTQAEMACRHTGIQGIRLEFMERLQKCRDLFGRPMPVSSGYRHTTHPIEARKNTTGEHTTGLCADILISGEAAIDLLDAALNAGFRRIGVNQAPHVPHDKRFIHLGMSPQHPAGLWSY